MKTTRSLLLAACTLIALSSGRATSVIPPTFDDLVAQAEVIFEGTVSEVKSEWAGEGAQRHIVSYVTFKVNDSLKGSSGAGTDYSLRMLGGTVDGVTAEVSDAPKFVIGDRDIVFVENNGEQFVPLVGIMHGRFRLKADVKSGKEAVSTDKGEPVQDLAKLGKEDLDTHAHAATSALPAISSDDFKAAIRAKLASPAK